MTDIPAIHTAQHLTDARRIVRRQAKFVRRRAASKRAWQAHRDGSQGAAGPCKRIDPVSGEVVEVVDVVSLDE